MNRAADRALPFLVATAVVLTSTVALPFITGYGTNLFQVVALGAWGLVALVASGEFADLNHWVVWPVAAILNLALFSIPALAIFLTTRKRSGVFFTVTLSLWLAFYLACLFVLFPATDGP